MPIQNVELIDKVLDNFNYSDFSLEPSKIIDEAEVDILKWAIESVDAGQKLEITYTIEGEGEYNPKDAQMAY